MRRRFWRAVAGFACKRAGGRFMVTIPVERLSAYPPVLDVAGAVADYERFTGQRVKR